MPRPKSCGSRKRKASAPKHTPEVFVLSPQLLQKLGININNIETPTPASSSNSVNAQDELFKKPKPTRKSNKTIEESSVMTTATLMKESVLLSPSFINQESIENTPVSSPYVNSPGHVQIMPNIKHVGNGPESPNILQKKDHLQFNLVNSPLAEPTATANADPINILKEYGTSGKLMSQQPSLIPSKIYTSYNLDQSCSDLQYHIQTYIAENELFNVKNDLPMCNKSKATVPDEDKLLITLNDLNIDDDHLDEAYSSDCSNGNNTISAVSAEFNLEPPKVGNMQGQKINILSEELIDESRLNEMISKSLSPSIKDKMIPVSVDTIMSFNRNITKSGNFSELTNNKCDSNSQDQPLSANVSIEQVSTADESFLDNIITGVMKIDEIDINILEVSDADINTHNLSNSVFMNVPESSESNKLDYTSDIVNGADAKDHKNVNIDRLINNLNCNNNVQIANVQDIPKVMIVKSHQVESNSDIFIEFIDKFPEVNESSLNTNNKNEYNCAIFSQIEAFINTSHDALPSKPTPNIEDSIDSKKHTEISNIEKAEEICSDIKDNVIKETKHKQDMALDDPNESGGVFRNPIMANDENLNTPTGSKIGMYTDTVCHCTCNMKNAKATHQAKTDVTKSNGKNEKLNEIASYLKMFVDNKRKKSAALYSKSRPANFSSEAVLKPKSCVHGVEKPGGSNKDKTRYEDDFNLKREAKEVPRTYKRNKNTYKPSKAAAVICNTIITHEKDINISDCIMPDTASNEYFCLCSDYGTFDFYDLEVKTYSHIHYWDNISEDFDIFAWFSEFEHIDYVEKNINEDKLFTEITETNEIILDPICWIGWDHSKKSIAKNLLFGNVVDNLVQMPNVTQIINLPDSVLEVTNKNDSNNISMENNMSQTKMVSQDNKTATNSIDLSTSQVEPADNPNNEFEVIYQVIEYLDESETVQADSSDSKLREEQVTNFPTEVDIQDKEHKKGDDNSDGQLLAQSQGPGIIEMNKHTEMMHLKQPKSSDNEDSYICKSNTYELSCTNKSNKSVLIAAEPKSKLHGKVLLHAKTKESKANQDSIRRTITNVNSDLVYSRNKRKLEKKASTYVDPEFNLKETSLKKGDATLHSDFNSGLNNADPKTTVKSDEEIYESKQGLQGRSLTITKKSPGNKSVEPEIGNNAKQIKSTRQTKREPSNDYKEESTKLEEKASNATFNKTKELINNCDKVSKRKSCSDVNTKINIDEENIRKMDKKESTKVNPVLNMKNLGLDKKLDDPEIRLQEPKLNLRQSNRKRSSNIETNQLDGTAKDSKRSKRRTSDDINDKSETCTKLEKRTCANNHIHDDISTNKFATKINSRNAKKYIKPAVDAEELNSIKREKVTNTDHEALKTNVAKTIRHTRDERKVTNQEVNKEKLNRYNEIDKIANSSDAVHDLITNESKTRRKSRNARKDIKPEIVAETVNSLNEEKANKVIGFPETNKKANTATVNDQGTKKSTTRRQSRNAGKYIDPDISAEDINKLIIRTDKITDTEPIKDTEPIHDPTPNDSTARRQSRNARKDIKPEVDAEKVNSSNITSTDAVRELKSNESTTRRQSRNSKKDIKLEVDAEELNSFKKTDNETSNDIKPSDITRRRSCRSQNTETPPAKLKTKRSQTSEDLESLKKKDLQSQSYLKEKDTMNTYESKKNSEQKANDALTPDHTLDSTPSSSGWKARVSDADSTSNTNISTPSDNNDQKVALLNEKPTKKVTKRKRSAIKSIDSGSKNTEATLSKPEESLPNTAPELDLSIEPTPKDIAVSITYVTECGVCEVQIEEEWIKHIAEKHSYLAWKKGEPVLDLNNPTAVKSHLKSIISETKQLTCSRCSSKLKNPKAFLEHIKNCDKSDDEDIALSAIRSKKAKRGKAVGETKTCGMCLKTVAVDEWESHVMLTHYNLAWAVGDAPTNLKDPNLIARLLKVYKSAGGQFKCNRCHLTRSSALGFYAHVVGCGKSAEEMEEHMEMCDQCQKPYLCVNRQPHMAWHTQMQVKKEAKIKQMMAQAEKLVEEPDSSTCGVKRKAARKAISLIQKLESSKDDSVTCDRCDFTGSTKEELKSHKCNESATFTDQGDVSEDSLEFASDRTDDEESDGEHSDVADAMSVSEDEKEGSRRKKTKCEHVSKYQRIPFEISSGEAVSYVENASKLFIKEYFSDDTLFEKWRNPKYTALNEEETETYTPPVEESCKFATSQKWTSLKRFESIKHPAITLFAGGCPASMCWVPGRLSTSDPERHYLALATHLGPDPPRYSSFKHYTSPGTVLQIWDFSHKPYAGNPKLSMCIAMDKGTVWSMSWCPSGARDSASSQDAKLLGLVAVACSDGTAYVYAVPHPALLSDDGIEPVFVKLKPVAELRLYYTTDKEICQPSKIFWSMQKGHEVIAVGYSNGMVAFYDLCAESPLTRKYNEDRDIFYPFFSQQALSSCITGMSMYPRWGGGAEGGASGGVWCAGAASGGTLGGAGAGAGAARLVPTGAASDTPFLPLWPAALLVNDDSVTNDMDFSGVVRRFSAAAAAAGCLHCSKLAQFSSPLLKTVVTHPVFKDMKKTPEVLIQMRRLKRDPEEKTSDHSNGKENSVSLEPFTYEKAVEEYGVRLKFCKKTDRLLYDKEFHPGRFPLSEVTAMAFCPDPKYHQWLAVATHSGLVFFIKTS